MAYERFNKALELYDHGELLDGHVSRLFDTLFEHIPESNDWLPATELDTLLAQGTPLSQIQETGPILFDEFDEAYVAEYVRVENPEVRAEFIGEIEINVGMPNPLPSADILNRLRRLELPDTRYRPDEDEQLDDELYVAIHVRGATLLATWLVSGYGDDIQPTHNELENLLARFDQIDDSPINMAQIRCLSKRVTAELAFQNGDYAAALDGIAHSIDYLHYYSEFTPHFTPWLSGVEARSREYFENIERMPGQNVDWPKIAKACEALGICFHNRFSEGDEYAFWMQQTGWAQAQLTPDQLRIYLRDREDEGSVQRLQTYFLPEELWKLLPKRAQEALVSADRALVSSTHGRRSGVANEIRIATEEVLYHYLWLPLSGWAGKQRPLPKGLKMILDKPTQQRRSPSINDQVDLLWHSETKAYFQSLGLSENDVQFLTKENRTTQHLKNLQRTRNTAEHEPGSNISSAKIRNLYAESLGIGRKGVLPELLHLLATDVRSTP